MNILVTGGLGFIGHNVVALLEQQGHTVVVIDSETDYGIIPRDELEYIVGERRCKIKTQHIYKHDITWLSTARLMQDHAIDCVVHLASFPRQKVVNANPMAGSRAMSEGLLNLLEASVRARIKKFVYISSSMVYGNFDSEHTNGGIEESANCCPLGQYGIMKLAGEWLVKDYQRRSDLSYTILRPSAVYGPYDVEDRVVSKFLLTAMRGGEIQVNGGTESLDFTFVSDLADGIVAATLDNNTNNRTYNVTRSHARTLLEAAELAVKIAGQGSIRVNNPDTNFPSRGQLNTVRAQNDFGFNPVVNIEQGFQEYYEWLNNSFYGIKKAV
jgi:nucleoside-diphosphate-sugar epimerase